MRAIVVAIVIAIMVVTMITIVIAIVVTAATIIRDRKTATALIWVIVMIVIVWMRIFGLWDIYGDLAFPHRMIGVCKCSRASHSRVSPGPACTRYLFQALPRTLLLISSFHQFKK